MGCEDIATNIKLFNTFFSELGSLDRSCSF
jgi:hypothetical protein